MVKTEFSWRDQVVVVTGAAGTMGREVTLELLARGASVAGLDRAEALERLEGDTEGHDGKYVGVEVDLGDLDSIVTAFATIDRELGSTTMLANIGGIVGGTESVLDADPTAWDRIMGVNVAGTFWMCREAIRRMREGGGGSIVNISSTAALRTLGGGQTHIYAISKAAVDGLTMSLAGEVGKWGIRVNCIAPGMHIGTMQKEMAGSAEAAEAFIQRVTRATPLGRGASGRDIVGPVLALLSPEFGFMTGQTVISDGGRVIWAAGSPVSEAD